METTERRYRCPSCGHEFQAEKQPEKCPACRAKVLVLIEGPSLRRSGGCTPSG